MYDLEKELLRLRQNFNNRLSKKFQPKIVQVEFFEKDGTGDVDNQIGNLKGIRKWLRFLNILND